jgi:hypothetical protein
VTHYDQGTISVLRDSAEGIQELPGAEVHAMNVPTIVRGVLRLAIDECRVSSTELLDIAGRMVLGLKPGPNDVSRLSPGIYFVRAPSTIGVEQSAVHKVVITE